MILWLTRRPLMKSTQRGFLRLIPAGHRAAAQASMTRQNRFARKIGFSVMRLMMNLLLGSILITTTFLTAMDMAEHGYLTMPWKLRRQIDLTSR
jgi:hypothetical protein